MAPASGWQDHRTDEARAGSIRMLLPFRNRQYRDFSPGCQSLPEYAKKAGSIYPAARFASACEKYLSGVCYCVPVDLGHRTSRWGGNYEDLVNLCLRCHASGGRVMACYIQAGQGVDDEDCSDLYCLLGCFRILEPFLLVLDGFWDHLHAGYSFGRHRGPVQPRSPSTHLGERVCSGLRYVL